MDDTTDALRDWITRRRLRGLLLRGTGVATPADVVTQLLAMQAQEHAYARWSVAQRTTGAPSAAAVDAAFQHGKILRTHVLRPTWHFIASRDLRWLMRLSGPRVDAANARQYHDLDLDERTLNRSIDVISDAVAGGAQTRQQLARTLEGQGIPCAGQRIGLLLMHAELLAVICSGPMQEGQHTYAAFDQRVPAGDDLAGDDALAELAWRYFSTRGPATVNDFSWWSGINATQARRALEMVQSRLASRDDDDRTYWFVDQGTPRAAHRVDLVQCYDELIISYRQTRDALQTSSATFPVPRHLDGFQHILLLDGRLLGHWRAHTDATRIRIETRIGARLDDREQVALADAIDRYCYYDDGPGTTHAA